MTSQLELHAWGPGFGLPSIEPQCLAAIAYLQCAVPVGSWVLVSSSDPALTPTSTPFCLVPLQAATSLAI